MRVRWENDGPTGWTANVGDVVLHAWRYTPDGWIAQCIEGTLNATHSGLASERAAKREAVRMWRALRGTR